MSLLNRTRRPGVIGALLGAIALVALIIVMVVIKRGNESDALGAATNQPPTPNKVETPAKVESPEPTPREPTTTDILVDPIPDNAIAPVDDTHVAAGSGSATKRKRKDKDPTVTAGSGSGSAGSGSAVAPKPDGDEDEDKWGHMQHDGDKKDAPKQ